MKYCNMNLTCSPCSLCRCDLCCLSFRTHRGLLRHNAGVHKLLPQDPSGRPFIQNNPSIPTGFNDLAFIDFSCKKFAHIAQVFMHQDIFMFTLSVLVGQCLTACGFLFQVWCETNLRRCVSKFHRFVCDSCDKAFPLHSALDLHKTTSHPHKPIITDPEENVEEAEEQGATEESQDVEKDVLPTEQAGFLQALGLQHISAVSFVTTGCTGF